MTPNFMLWGRIHPIVAREAGRRVGLAAKSWGEGLMRIWGGRNSGSQCGCRRLPGRGWGPGLRVARRRFAVVLEIDGTNPFCRKWVSIVRVAGRERVGR